MARGGGSGGGGGRLGVVAAGRLDPDALGPPAGFIARHRRDGTLATYQISFLMVDHLVARHGFASVVAYFRAFTERRDRQANFRRVFGQTVTMFEQEFVTDLATKRQCRARERPPPDRRGAGGDPVASPPGG